MPEFQGRVLCAQISHPRPETISLRLFRRRRRARVQPSVILDQTLKNWKMLICLSLRPGTAARPPPDRPGTPIGQQTSVRTPAVSKPVANKFVCGVKGTHRELRSAEPEFG